MANDFANVDSADLQKNKYQLLSQGAVGALLEKDAFVKGVKILDYGQGDCNAIVDQKGRPLIFFDMGGGKHTGSRSHPWHESWIDDYMGVTPASCTRAPDIALQPTVILSHWDGDHYSTAWYMVNHDKTSKKVPDPNEAKKVKDLRWLVPRQCKHPSKLEFVLDLKDLRCWPEGTTTHTFKLTSGTSLVVDKCMNGGSGSAYDPNLDGLAVVLEREKSGQVERMVLPGDAPFHVIPSCKKGLDKVVLLLAFHHGSRTHLEEAKDCIPEPLPGKGEIAYTFGLKPNGGRCYGHPNKEAIKEYEEKGWKERLVPSGGKGAFKNWPPDETEDGDPKGRNDVFKDFKVADTPIGQVPDPGAVQRPYAIALRRRKPG
jgi:hypothetical protein